MMNRHLTSSENLLADACSLGRAEARHLQTVLRVKQGDRIQLFDGQGRTREVTVTAADKHGLSLATVAPVVEHPQAACRLTLFVCVSKGKRMDWTIEKAVELGVSEIVPVISGRTIVRIADDDAGAKADRWMRVAEEAARQCGAAWLPRVYAPVAFEESLAKVREVSPVSPVFVAALTADARPLREVLLPGALGTSPANPTVSEIGRAGARRSRAGWFVGPEGDFTAEELDALIRVGAIPVSLGQNVLRAETACIYGLSVLNCFYQ